jgi:hypothetical protein
MPDNFFRKRACIEARDHGEPSRAVKSAERRNGINGGDPKLVEGEEARLCRIRVTLDRTARRGLFPRGERSGFADAETLRGKIGRRYGNLGFRPGR